MGRQTEDIIYLRNFYVLKRKTNSGHMLFVKGHANKRGTFQRLHDGMCSLFQGGALQTKGSSRL